jgi:Holliday junction resolvase RusA-like endonuclease
MEYSFTISGRLPSLNEYISAMNSNRHAGNKLKQENMTIVSWEIKTQLKSLKIEKPVIIKFRWYEKNRKRDIDGFSSMGKKIIFDALVRCGVLKNDTQEWVRGFEDGFYIDSDNPRIEIIIVEG